jgi:hypothetical protein
MLAYGCPLATGNQHLVALLYLKKGTNNFTTKMPKFYLASNLDLHQGEVKIYLFHIVMIWVQDQLPNRTTGLLCRYLL